MDPHGWRCRSPLIALALVLSALLAAAVPLEVIGATEPHHAAAVLPDEDEAAPAASILPDGDEAAPGEPVLTASGLASGDAGEGSRSAAFTGGPPPGTELDKAPIPERLPERRAPTGPSLMGIQSDIQPDSPQVTRKREIGLMQQAGVTWVRIVLNWYAAEPHKGLYNEEYLKGMESLIDEIHASGMQAMLLILATPPWANLAGWQHPPLRMRDIGDFVGYAVRRYSSRVKYWEIWNEPDWHEFWKPAPDVRGFVEMLREAYAKGKAADHQAVFISGGLAGNNIDYLRQMYALGGRSFFDVLGVHPYVFQRSPDEIHPHIRNSFHGIAELRQIMVANGDSHKPIWITEMSWPTNRRAPGATGDWAEGVSYHTQASHLARAYEKIAQEYRFVQVAMWYNLRDKGTNPTLAYHNYGLVQNNFEPKPAYIAYQRLAQAVGALVATRP